MKSRVSVGEALKENSIQLILVVAAFLVLLSVAYYFCGSILRNQRNRAALDSLAITEANIRAGLSESDARLNNSYYTLQGMIEQGASQEAIHQYLIDATEWLQKQDQGLVRFYSLYGYYEGAFLDGLESRAQEDYVPQRQSWYQTAIRAGNSIAYTAPYHDPRSGHRVISATRNMEDRYGNVVGVIALDMDIAWFEEYLNDLASSTGGYGILMSQTMSIMNHPNAEYQGIGLQDLGGPYRDIARTLWSGSPVTAVAVKDLDGTQALVFFRQLFNGWFLGLVVPIAVFYRDMVIAALVLGIAGIALIIALSGVLVRLSLTGKQEDAQTPARSSFLARVSHEIRNPMNAIIGITEIAGREIEAAQGDPPNLVLDRVLKLSEYISSIKRAGNNLIVIIDDILDYSKIETGQLDIVPRDYSLSHFLTDLVAICDASLSEKPVTLLTRIDGSLPARLNGDEVRMRQLLFDLFTNAANYTNQGNITLTVRRDDAQKRKDELDLIFEIADTGIGLSPDSLEKLTAPYSQIEDIVSLDASGAGFGYAITRSLISLMGGSLGIESTEGLGSRYTITLPQQIIDTAPIAQVRDPLKKQVLVYEDRLEYQESFSYTLRSLGVQSTLVDSIDALRASLQENRYDFLFISNSHYEYIHGIVETLVDGIAADSPAPSDAEMKIVLYAEYWEVVSSLHALSISMPLHPLPLAQLLNGDVDDPARLYGAQSLIQFIAPQAHILAVDDNVVNLHVLEGLLAPYQIRIDTCTSGMDGIQAVKAGTYDLILMDHMMPGMSGIEATQEIRNWEKVEFAQSGKEIPIIAFTANVAYSAREMFLQSGFNDFLSKPIDISRLDAIIRKWIPQNKQLPRQVQESSAPPPPEGLAIPAPLRAIQGVDGTSGLSNADNDVARFRNLLTSFYRDALARGRELSRMKIQGNIAVLTNHFQALKTASLSIGATGFSQNAERMENLGIAQDVSGITAALPGFLKQLEQLIRNIGGALKQLKEDETRGRG